MVLRGFTLSHQEIAASVRNMKIKAWNALGKAIQDMSTDLHVLTRTRQRSGARASGWRQSFSRFSRSILPFHAALDFCRFESQFSYDGNGLPRIWTNVDDIISVFIDAREEVGGSLTPKVGEKAEKVLTRSSRIDVPLEDIDEDIRNNEVGTGGRRNKLHRNPTGRASAANRTSNSQPRTHPQPSVFLKILPHDPLPRETPIPARLLQKRGRTFVYQNQAVRGCQRWVLAMEDGRDDIGTSSQRCLALRAAAACRNDARARQLGCGLCECGLGERPGVCSGLGFSDGSHAAALTDSVGVWPE
ncbi:hypothetical protein BDK51DRAFT_44773 [Blyttiomyces helicus]|uniref:Sey1/RHD3-like three-helix bundle domain-containing protein n=1 Tax=Blyttiomyces helicus TaxID=388810 RepID=A0A4P9VYN4_9FUNG|nr:hypothetical protein BDK51DRAFT_44773 [Blyttiomyces helicus]|eukprot:RKO83440.1 hypothetical protein BDK51DRAFT_44773 [Blyttiomyces helicus]